MCSSWREFRRESCNASRQVYIYNNYTPEERAQIGNLRPREWQYLRARATAIWEEGVSSEINESLEWQTALTGSEVGMWSGRGGYNRYCRSALRSLAVEGDPSKEYSRFFVYGSAKQVVARMNLLW